MRQKHYLTADQHRRLTAIHRTLSTIAFIFGWGSLGALGTVFVRTILFSVTPSIGGIVVFVVMGMIGLTAQALRTYFFNPEKYRT